MKNPLAAPTDRSLLTTFLEHYGISGQLAPERLLREVVRAFSSLPYENLTKIIMQDEAASAESARRAPDRVLSDHLELGSGGTCFSLTAALLHMVRAVGFEAEPLLADRHYGADTHCALLVWIDSRPHLIDPGYLVLEPIPLFSGDRREIATRFNRIALVAKANGCKIDLFTLVGRSATYRLTYKASPADAAEFLRAWDGSFRWEMMTYPLLTRVLGDAQVYLRGNRMLIRSPETEKCVTIHHEYLIDSIVRDFGIARSVAVRALSILSKKRGADDQAASG